MIYMDTIVLGYMKGCVVEAVAGQFCKCKQHVTDSYGTFLDYVPHDHWMMVAQKHSNPMFAYYLQCELCDYQLARQYWTDKDGEHIDYLTMYTMIDNEWTHQLPVTMLTGHAHWDDEGSAVQW